MNKNIQSWYDAHSGEVTALSDDLFREPEVGLDTYKSCRKVADFMKGHGFEVEVMDVTGKGGEPNGLVAKFGSGKPVIGILGELDALPGLGAEPKPAYAPLPAEKPGPGHGCGHHLMGAGCAASAAAMKQAMEAENIKGTLIYYGCPAEETLDGKIYMAKLGLFDDLDFCVAWHPMNTPPSALESSMQANCSIFFNFYGKTAHAAGNPADGRSALDAAELMNVGVNYLREHVPDDVRIHYCYINAGEKPNIVPDYARLHYFVRAKTQAIASEVLERVKACAEGAALMTGTTTDNELYAFCYETLVNHRANRFLYESQKKIPNMEFEEAEIQFAKDIYKNITGKEATHDLLPVEPVEPKGILTYGAGSTEVGDVSHITPTVQLFGGAMVPGLPNHHWATTAVSGSSIGHKAELYAGKVLAQTCYDAFHDPKAIEEMWAEFKEARKDMKPYEPGLPE